jgi:hypothetical protein
MDQSGSGDHDGILVQKVARIRIREAELNGECGICGAYLRLMRPCSDCGAARVCAS